MKSLKSLILIAAASVSAVLLAAGGVASMYNDSSSTSASTKIGKIETGPSYATLKNWSTVSITAVDSKGFRRVYNAETAPAGGKTIASVPSDAIEVQIL